MTLIIIIVTSIVSVLAFSNRELFSKLQFNPYQVYHRKEYYRLISHGFVHADWMHLLVNMIVLYSFGTRIEQIFGYLQDQGVMRYAKVWFVMMYVVSIAFASLTTLKKYKDDFYYNSVGASGAVSAVLFCSIFFEPWNTLQLFFAIPIPAVIFGVIYLFYSQYMSKRNSDNINHDAHFVGAVFGFLFPLIIKFDLIFVFINQLLKR